MAEGAIFVNSGPLFNGDRLEALEDLPEWEHDSDARSAFDRVREIFERHATVLAGGPSVEETRFNMVNPTLHALGYTHSVYEAVEIDGDKLARVDYALFGSAEDFYDAQPSRGGMGFFRPAVGVAKAAAWNAALDEAEEEGDLSPAAELDLLLRTTGKDYGILTNGCDWRIYHRGTSSLISTFFQADMIGAIKSDFEDFKRFYLLFRAPAMRVDDSGTCFLDRMLQ